MIHIQHTRRDALRSLLMLGAVATGIAQTPTAIIDPAPAAAPAAAVSVRQASASFTWCGGSCAPIPLTRGARHA